MDATGSAGLIGGIQSWHIRFQNKSISLA